MTKLTAAPETLEHVPDVAQLLLELLLVGPKPLDPDVLAREAAAAEAAHAVPPSLMVVSSTHVRSPPFDA